MFVFILVEFGPATGGTRSSLIGLGYLFIFFVGQIHNLNLITGYPTSIIQNNIIDIVYLTTSICPTGPLLIFYNVLNDSLIR